MRGGGVVTPPTHTPAYGPAIYKTLKPRLHEHQVPNPDSNLDHSLHGRGGLSLDSNPDCLRVNATNLDQDLDKNARVNGALEEWSCPQRSGPQIRRLIGFSPDRSPRPELEYLAAHKSCTYNHSLKYV